MNKNQLVPKAVGEEEFDTVYSDAAQYGRIQFWDERYASFPEAFEWYYGYETLQDIINMYFPDKSAKIMIAGCGNSHFIEDMNDDGYDNLVGVDLSRVCIAIMNHRCKHRKGVTFHQGTMQDTDLPRGEFEGVIDKALMDALFCTNTGATNVKQYIMEVDGLLSHTGTFIVVSHGTPEDRIGHLEQYDLDQQGYTPWYTEVQAVPKPEQYDGEVLDLDDPDNSYFIYCMKKNETLVNKKLGKALKDLKNKNKKKQQAKAGAPQL